MSYKTMRQSVRLWVCQNVHGGHVYGGGIRVRDTNDGGTTTHWTCSRCYTVLDADKESPARTESPEQANAWRNRRRIGTGLRRRWSNLSRWWKGWSNRKNLTCDNCGGTGRCGYCDGKGWDDF